MMIELNNPVDWVKEHPQIMLRSSLICGENLAHRVVHDAFVSKVKSMKIEQIENWWIIAGINDWLSYKNLSINDLFNKLIPFPEMGQECHRSEILLTAFADNIFTVLDKSFRWITPKIEIPIEIENWLRNNNYVRVIAFSMSTSTKMG